MRYRDTTGEGTSMGEALDLLDVRIVPDHWQRDEQSQWRLIAGDLAAYVPTDILEWARRRHIERVGLAPDFDPSSYEEGEHPSWH